jgi:hypothetical protein
VTGLFPAHGDNADVNLGAPGGEPAARLFRMGGSGEGDRGRRVMGSVVEVAGGDFGWWRDYRAGVAGVEAVQAQQGVEVDGSAGLEFGGFAVGHPDRRHRAVVALAVADPYGRQATATGELAKVTFDRLFGATPQFPGRVVPHHVGAVVVTAGTDRLAQPWVVAVVAGETHDRRAVLAGGGVAAGVAGIGAAGAPGPVGTGVVANGAGVHRAEGGGGEGGEHGRVRGDGLGDALATDQPGADDVVGVAAVGLGAGAADRVAAVPACLVDHLVGYVAGGVGPKQLPGRRVDDAQVAVQTHRVSASGGGPDVIEPGEVAVTGARQRGVGGPAR